MNRRYYHIKEGKKYKTMYNKQGQKLSIKDDRYKQNFLNENKIFQSYTLLNCIHKE